MKLSNLKELFVHELKDLYDAEHQLVEALPKLADTAKNPELAEAFRNHLEETREHVNRLEAVFQALGREPERERCEGMKGLLEEGKDLMKQNADDDVLDAALIGAAQRVEHYEIAAYGTLRVWALTAGLDEAVKPLEATLAEEKNADEKLTEIAEAGVNVEAEVGESEEAEMQTARAPARQRSPSRSRTTKPARSRRTTKAR